MEKTSPLGKVFAIVPAHNEEKFLQNVLHQLNAAKNDGIIHEIIVVDDGSKDNTSKIAEKEGATVLRLRRNMGKAIAIETGFKHAAAHGASIAMMFDADLGEIKTKSIAEMLAQLRHNKELKMVVASTPLKSGVLEDPFSGERAVRISAIGGILKGVKSWQFFRKTRYGLEEALNHLIPRKNIMHIGIDFKKRRKGGVYQHMETEVGTAHDYATLRSDYAYASKVFRGIIARMPAKERHKTFKKTVADNRRFLRKQSGRLLSRMRKIKRI